MDKIKNIFSKKKPETEKEEEKSEADVPVIEVSETAESQGVGEISPIIVKSMDLTRLSDVQTVIDELEAGNIVILNISPLMDEDPSELKRAVDDIRSSADDVGGDVGRLSESRIIVTPELVKIQFRREQ
ncbi:MAG: cell division protein SepF [Candidatus Hadarchaeia archaeon]